MTSSSVNTIMYYNGVIITTRHVSTFVSGSLKIVQLDNKMSLGALKQAIGNKISLPNGKVVNDIYFLLPISFFGDCDHYRACMLHDDDDIMNIFSLGKSPSLHAWSYILQSQTHPHKDGHIHHQFLQAL
ncbi:hypothetical protein GmHk_07G018912 [Glycine max]|nr:hypothetical protein GmHk_07G018912 [Glycine max]